MTSPLFDEKRPITRSLSRQLGLQGGNPAANGELTASGSFRVKIRTSRDEEARQGILRCVCDGFLLSPHDQLLECQKCRNWCHALCVGFDTRVTPITAKIRKDFLCPFCDGNSDSRKRKREHVSTKPQPVQLLREVPDSPPSDVALLETLRQKVKQWAKSHGYLLLSWPDPEQSTLTDEQAEQCLECCSTSITDATFSESYPRYCFAEQRQQVHRYLQMACMYHIASKRIVSTVVSNGMDPYGNMKATVSGLKSAISRGLVPADSPCAQSFSTLSDFSDFVHYNLVVTHDDFRGKRLAKALLLHETIRWCKRGRNRAFVNMALAKRYDDTGKHIIYSVHVASQALYRSFGYIDVHPKVDHTTGEDRYTKKEADFGRMLANLDTKGPITDVCQALGIATRNRK